MTVRTPTPSIPARSRSREDECLRRFRADADTAAMEEFVRLTRPRLVAVARRIGARQDAEDSVQAAYHALLRRTDLPGDLNAMAWLVTATVRIAYRRKAVVRREAAVAQRLARSRQDGASHHALSDEESALVRDAVHRLTRRYRDVLVLHHLEELPLADVARLLDVPVATAKTRAQRGRALLRLRLESRFALGVFAAPWLLAESVRASPVVGGIVQAKAAVAAIALIAAAIAVGVAVREGASGRSSESADAEASAIRRVDAKPTTASRPRRRADEEIAPPPGDATAAAGVPAQTQPNAADPAASPDEAAIEARIVEAAKSLGVSEAALRAANDAYVMLRDRPETGAVTAEEYRVRRAASLAPLTAHGEQGFLALVAMLRGGRQGTYFEELVPATAWRGRLELLIELAEHTDGPKWVDHTALGCLGATDAPEARDYLVARLRRERSPGLTMCTAESLGRLKEPRGVLAAREFLRSPGAMSGPTWNDVTAGGVFDGVMQMDKDAGGRLLAECARDPEFAYPVLAIDALGRNGRGDLARPEAEAFVASRGERVISSKDAAILEKWAKSGR